METTRRGFLKILGIGGTAAAVGGGLFSESLGNLLVGSADHYVYDVSARGATGVLLTPDARAYFLWKATTQIADDSLAGPVGHLILRNPKSERRASSSRNMHGKMVHAPAKRQPSWAPAGEPSVYQVDCPIGPGQEPHVEFFMAASRLRDKINDDVQEFAQTLQQRSLVMVTMVDVPIMAFPHPDKGFYLETQISQFATNPHDIENPRDAESMRGEVPIEMPGDIDFKYLMLMQEQLQSMGMLNGHDRQKLHDRPTFVRAWERVAGESQHKGFRKV